MGKKGDDLRRELERIINAKLTMAMENTAGYGLDTLGGDVPRGSFMLAQPSSSGVGTGNATRGGPGGRVQQAVSDSEDDDDDGFMIPILGGDVTEAKQAQPSPSPHKAHVDSDGDDDVFQIPVLGDDAVGVTKGAVAQSDDDDGGYSDDDFGQIPVLGEAPAERKQEAVVPKLGSPSRQPESGAAPLSPASAPAAGVAATTTAKAAVPAVVGGGDDDGAISDDSYTDDDFAYDDDDFDDEDE